MKIYCRFILSTFFVAIFLLFLFFLFILFFNGLLSINCISLIILHYKFTHQPNQTKTGILIERGIFSLRKIFDTFVKKKNEKIFLFLSKKDFFLDFFFAFEKNFSHQNLKYFSKSLFFSSRGYSYSHCHLFFLKLTYADFSLPLSFSRIFSFLQKIFSSRKKNPTSQTTITQVAFGNLNLSEVI